MSDVLTLAETGQASELWKEVRQRALDSLYYCTKVVLGYGLLTPSLHLPLCDFFQHNKTRRQGILLPRGHFKSTIFSKAYPIWRIACEKILNGRDIAILIARETDEGGTETLREIRGQLERNSILQWIFPEIIPLDLHKTKWSEHAIILPRSVPRSEATITVCGVGAAITGSHFDIIIKDDLIAIEAAQSEAVMHKAIQWHQYSEGLFTDPTVGEDILVGTRWTDTDLYSWVEEHEPEYSFYIRSAVEDGVPIFPERFPLSTLDRIRAKQGDYMYSCQFGNDPVSIEGSDFKPQWLRSYAVRENRHIHIPDVATELVPEQLDRVGYFDPTHEGYTGTAEHALVVVGMDCRGWVYCLDNWAKRTSLGEALHQMQLLNDQWNCRWLYEAVGAQRYLGTLIQQLNAQSKCLMCNKTHRRLAAQPDDVTKKLHKDERIRMRLQPLLEHRQLLLRQGQDKLRNQILRFPLGKLKDLVDAVAGAVPHLRRPRSIEEHFEHEQQPGVAPPEMKPYTQTSFVCG
jgi:hypothetical protein